MKSLTKYLIESKTKTFNIKLSDWFTWYFGDDFKGKITKDIVYNDAGLDASAEELNMKSEEFAKFLNAHLNDDIELKSEDIGNCIENIFTVGDVEIGMDSIDFYGTELD